MRRSQLKRILKELTIQKQRQHEVFFPLAIPMKFQDDSKNNPHWISKVSNNKSNNFIFNYIESELLSVMISIITNKICENKIKYVELFQMIEVTSAL